MPTSADGDASPWPPPLFAVVHIGPLRSARSGAEILLARDLPSYAAADLAVADVFIVRSVSRPGL
jgi:hypothetical protein